ncbi:TetR family transcriptional regulator [Marinobacter santoriniensis NKSG1]|uniref:TetR family transcriptional regulator n=1 Tax=Marinobacter santoriniensis NKSG1 TaxID=1288826 RepID=M7CSX7_9GAMM|nr:TetR family transcriptional regulator [Marinobacter santoriniensis]EMP56254.1 TetR family transcriptional regulator [Marinobacter santoriniensis NKSG1]
MKGMLCSGRQRARTEAEKIAREQHILDAAAELFVNRRYDQLTLADVAAASGLTKAALYRYFRSKELLFIAVYRRAFTALVDDAEGRQSLALPDDLTGLLVTHPLFCGLTAILHMALETGLTEQEARNFKLFLLEQSQRLAELIQAATGHAESDCFKFLLQCQQALIGCWHMTHPPEAARKAMERPPLTVFKLEFEPTLHSHIQSLYFAFLTKT